MTGQDIAQAVWDLVAGNGHQVRQTATWIHVVDPRHPLPEHGWKFHVSVRPAEFAEVATMLVPHLLAADCSFKLARSVQVLAELNDGAMSPATVGKAFTIYPDQAEVARLGATLVGLLRGRQGPRVLSDRQVDPDAPVYYRYGPFRARLVAGEDGNLTATMIGPDGEVFDGAASLTYRQPPWATDPFRPDQAERVAASGEPVLLGGHYRPFKGLLQSARGNVYAATDVRTGETVVLKQARAHVGESSDGTDARLRLRNERLVLTALRDVAGVARFRDHFRHATDEYLVTSFDGKFNLAQDVTRNGRYRPMPAPGPSAAPRSLDWLAREVAEPLREAHARGFVLRDLSPKNVVVSTAGDAVTLVDFGICHHGDVTMLGGTAGYAPARQLAGEPAEVADDLYALGMTLVFAATSASPILAGDDPDGPRIAALQLIERIYGDQLPPSIAAAAGLLSGDRETAEAAMAALAGGEPVGGRPFQPRPAAPGYRRGPDAAALVDTVLDQLSVTVTKVLDESAPGDFADTNVYRGTAGIGLAMLPHRDRPDVAATIDRLAEFSARTAEWVKLKPGLYLGSTGVEIFLRRTGTAPTLPPELVVPEGDWAPEGDDVIVGAAGIGLGHLLLAELDPRPEHAAMVRRCFASVSRHTDPVSMFPPEDVPVAAGLDVDAGVAHGQAGVIEFLLAVARREPSAECERQLATRIAWLVERVPPLIARASEATAVPLCASWCRGMAGIGRVLLAAGRQRADTSLIDLATACGHACRDWVPYLTTPGQCCGVAGVGELFLDLAAHQADERFVAAAESAASQLLLLGATAPPAAPGRRNADQPSGISWASGAAGILAYLTRLRDFGDAAASGRGASVTCSPFV